MTAPLRPSAADALAQLRRKSAAEALAELRGGSQPGGHGFASPQVPTDRPVPERTPTQAEIESIRDQAEQRALADVGTTILQGGSGGWADEAVGLVSPDAKAAMRADVARIRRENPVASMGGEAVGAALNPVLNLGFGSGIVRNALVGGGYGALFGAGNAETMQDIPAEATGGGLAGALTAGTLTAGAKISGKIVNALRNWREASPEAKAIVAKYLKRAVMGYRGEQMSAALEAMQPKPPAIVPDAAQATALPDVVLPGHEWPRRALNADALQAMRDFDAGKISGEDLRTALDVAAGRTSSDPVPTAEALAASIRSNPPLKASEVPAVVRKVAAQSKASSVAPGPLPGFDPPQGPALPPGVSATREPTYQELYPEYADKVDAMLREARGTPAPKTVETPLRLTDKVLGGAKIVAPGPTQRANPGTRMQSAPMEDPNLEGLLSRTRYDKAALNALPEAIKRIPEAELETSLDLALAHGSAPSPQMAVVANELATRRGQTLDALITARKAALHLSLRKVLADESGRLGPLYHGSPHKFDKFDLSKIGTGEGAQAYGHGLYFAENPGVAKTYQPPEYDLKVTRNLEAPGNNKALDALRIAHGDKEIALGLLRKQQGILERGRPNMGPIDAEENAYNLIKVKSAISQIEGGHVELQRTGGALYTAELPHANPEDFLDWDKPLSQQSEKVRKALEKLASQRSSSAVRDALQPMEHGNTTGETIVRLLTSDGAEAARLAAGGKDVPAVAMGQQAASDALRSAGIKGIRYLDGGSRGNGAAAAHWKRVLAEGNTTGEYGGLTRQQVLDKLDEAKNALSSNYVVFDDNDINILHREGNTGLKMLLGMTGAGAAAAAAPKLVHRK